MDSLLLLVTALYLEDYYYSSNLLKFFLFFMTTNEGRKWELKMIGYGENIVPILIKHDFTYHSFKFHFRLSAHSFEIMHAFLIPYLDATIVSGKYYLFIDKYHFTTKKNCHF